MANGKVYNPVTFRESITAYDADNFILQVSYTSDVDRKEVRELAEAIAQRNNAVLRESCKERGLTYYAPKESKPRAKKEKNVVHVDITGIEIPNYDVGCEIQGCINGKLRARVVDGDKVYYSQYFDSKKLALKAAYKLNLDIKGTADNWTKKIEAANKRYRDKIENALIYTVRDKDIN